MTESNGRQMTLNALLDEYKIVIPIIQRDYAHGREEEADVRNGFLDTLYEAIASNGNPTVLDYIYGSIDKSTRSFLPIDGQQRLTTLYLLYWYLSVKDGISKNYLYKFKYEVRDSATEFCEGLSRNIISLQCPPSEEIREAAWYHNVYETDPTVLSMLNMLDAIHGRFYKIENGCDALENEAVTFWVLPLEGFGLTDDLFIKMNARGKRTSKFDVFKSKFEQRIDAADLPDEQREEWKDKIDNEWLDFFWNSERPSLAEQQLLNFIVFVARTIRAKREKEYTDISDISETEQRIDMEILSEADNFDFLIYALDDLHNIRNHYVVKGAFDNIVNGRSATSYPDRVRLYAILRYRYKSGGKNDADFERLLKNLISGQRRVQVSRKQFESSIVAATLGGFLKSMDIFIDEVVNHGSIIAAFKNSELRGCNFAYLPYEKEKVFYFAPDGIVDKQKYDEIIALESIPELSGLIHCFFFENKCWLTHLQISAILNPINLKPKSLLRCLQAFANINMLSQQFNGQWKEIEIFTDPQGSQRRIERFHKYFLGQNKSDIWGDYLLSADTQHIQAVNTLVKELAALPFVNIKDEVLHLLKLKFGQLNKNDERYYFARYSEFYGEGSSDACVCLKSQYKNRDYYLLRVFINRDVGFRGDLSRGKHYNPYYKALQNMLIKKKSDVTMSDPDAGSYWGKYTHQWIRFSNGCLMRMCYKHDTAVSGGLHYWEVDTKNTTAPISAAAQAMLNNDELDCIGEDCIEIACDFVMAM